jgi:AraC-like DNA-binding protein
MGIPETHIIPRRCRERFLDLRSASARPLRQRRVMMAGISDLVAPYEMGRPAPRMHVLLHTLGGRGTLETLRRRRLLIPGTVLIAPAGVPYRYAASGKWRIAWFHFAGAERRAGFTAAEPEVRDAGAQASLVAAMEGYVAESVRPGADGARAAEAYAEIIGVHLDRELGPRGSPAQQRVARALNALWRSVHADLGRRWTVSELAEAMHVSAAHLHRIVGALHGTTPMGVVTRMRMLRAEDLLRHTDFPLKLIADMTGYETPFAFSRAFKRHAGVSPRPFREAGGHDRSR